MKVIDAARAVSSLTGLIGRLMIDRRVPLRTRLVVVAAGVYAITPIDLVPDWIPFVGGVDDLLVAAWAFDRLLDAAGDSIIHEHWHGPEDALHSARNAVRTAASLVPRPVSRGLNTLVGR